MASCITLLFPCLLALLHFSQGGRVPPSLNRTRHNHIIQMLTLINQTAVSQLKETGDVHAGLQYSLPAVVPGIDGIQGLGSIMEGMLGFQKMGLQAPLTTHLNNLSGYLRTSMDSLGCPARATPSFEDLESFMSENQGFVTVYLATLKRLEEYSVYILKNREVLKC